VKIVNNLPTISKAWAQIHKLQHICNTHTESNTQQGSLYLYLNS